MNRSKTDFSTTARRQWRAGGVCQESRRTTTTTESESDKSQVSTVKNSTLAREAALEPFEEQSNSLVSETQQVCPGSVRNCSAANDWPPIIAGMLKNGMLSLSMLNPKAAVFCPAASEQNGGGIPEPFAAFFPPSAETARIENPLRGATYSAPTVFHL